MSTVAEIEAAIDKLPPEDFRALQAWMSQRSAYLDLRKWSPEQLVEGARQMLAETDRDRADVVWKQTVAGFYGDKGA